MIILFNIFDGSINNYCMKYVLNDYLIIIILLNIFMNDYAFVQLDKIHLLNKNIYNNYVNLSAVNTQNKSRTLLYGSGPIPDKNVDNNNPIIVKTDDEDKKCAPSKKFEKNSCFTMDGLKDIATAFNTYVYMKKIKGKKVIVISDDKQDLLNQIDDRLKDICDDQLCWLEQDFIKVIEHEKREELVDNTFRPDGPKGRFTWLSTTDIDAVLNQYDFHKDFEFLGTVPMDFDDLPVLNINNLNFDDLYDKGIYKLGMVINTDEHYKSGQHWIAFYADLKKKQIYFSDSYARVPEDRVRNLVERIAIWMAKKYHNFTDKPSAKFMMKDKKNNIESLPGIDIRYNQTRHQYKNSECGVYSMHFVLWLLEGKTFDEYIFKQITDDEINQFREKYFVYHDE